MKEYRSLYLKDFISLEGRSSIIKWVCLLHLYFIILQFASTLVVLLHYKVFVPDGTWWSMLHPGTNQYHLTYWYCQLLPPVTLCVAGFPGDGRKSGLQLINYWKSRSLFKSKRILIKRETAAQWWSWFFLFLLQFSSWGSSKRTSSVMLKDCFTLFLLYFTYIQILLPLADQTWTK